MAKICALTPLLIALLARGALANLCGLPRGASVGTAVMSSSQAVVAVTAGLPAGLSRSTGTVLSTGFQTMALAAFTCFMSTDTPLAVEALPGSPSVQLLVPSADQTMTLEWTQSLSVNPVTYNVYVGTCALAMAPVAAGLSAASQFLSNLAYTTPYHWQVSAADQFGRYALSQVYTFSIAPVVDHLIAAPNPMHPGHGTTTFLFSMPGPGSAVMEIFSLPDARLVFRQSYPGLQDGEDTIVYDGRENDGRYLPNGVYTIRLIKSGANGNATELFKLVSAR